MVTLSVILGLGRVYMRKRAFAWRFAGREEGKQTIVVDSENAGNL